MPKATFDTAPYYSCQHKPDLEQVFETIEEAVEDALSAFAQHVDISQLNKHRIQVSAYKLRRITKARIAKLSEHLKEFALEYLNDRYGSVEPEDVQADSETVRLADEMATAAAAAFPVTALLCIETRDVFISVDEDASSLSWYVDSPAK